MAGESKVGAASFYSLNGVVFTAMRDQTRFVMNGIDDLHWLENRESLKAFAESKRYSMAEYDYDGKTDIDGLIIYKCDIRRYR